MNTILDIFDERVATSADSVALRRPVEGGYEDVAWTDWWDEAQRWAAGLQSLGVESGDRVGILMGTRYEWVVADQAILAAGAVVVPLYPSTLARHCRFMLGDSGVSVLFVEGEEQRAKVESVWSDLPELRAIVVVDAETLDSGEQASTRRHGGEVIDILRLRERGAEHAHFSPNAVAERTRAVAPESLASIVYTPGTTGRPKGVMLSHRNFVVEVDGIARRIPIGAEDEQLLALPIAHVFVRVIYLTAIRLGCVTTFSRGWTELERELKEVRPTFFAGVPHIFEALHTRVVRRAQEETGPVRRRLFQWSTEVGRRRAEVARSGESPSLTLDWSARLADQLVLRRLRRALGDRVRFALCGGAPIAPELQRFFDGCGVPILVSYGLTENCSAATLTIPSEYRVGTVGRSLPHVEIRIAEDGEVLLRGDNVMVGYWDDPEATSTTIEDGWLHTGDVGHLDEDGYLVISDRKKDLIITASGRNIAPQPIEQLLVTIPLVSHAFVHGEGRKHLTALVTVDGDALAAWAQDAGVADLPVEQQRQSPELYAAIRSAIDELNRELPAHEHVRDFAVLPGQFDEGTGEVTPTLKIRRAFLESKYRQLLDKLYESHG